MSSKGNLFALILCTACTPFTYADGLSEAVFNRHVSVFGGGGLVFTQSIQSVKTAVSNGTSYPYDEVLVASNINGGANVGVEYDFNPYVGVDFDYTYRGKQAFGITYQTALGVDVIGATAQTQNYALEGLFFLPLSQVKPYMKVGYARYRLVWDHYSGVPGVSINQTAIVKAEGNAITYGLGTRFPVTASLDIGAFVDAIYLFNNSSVSTSLSQYYPGVNVVYRMGI
ncbi:MAG: outer membrane beta-barrel protein [Legionellaceae bacterium]